MDIQKTIDNAKKAIEINELKLLETGQDMQLLSEGKDFDIRFGNGRIICLKDENYEKVKHLVYELLSSQYHEYCKEVQSLLTPVN